jgi:penicillin-binding protein 1A
MDYRRNALHRRLMTGTSRWYQIRHAARNPRIQKWAGIIAAFFVIVFYFAFLFGMPSISDIQTSFKESSIIYDREGNQLYTIYGGDENRQYVAYKDISPTMVHAIVAMEDQRFFSNF